jgi:hypothetical protein
MKLYFKNAAAVAEGIALLSADLDIEAVSEAEAALAVTVCEAQADTLTVSLDNKQATITYGGGTARFSAVLPR